MFFATWSRLRNFGYGTDKLTVHPCWKPETNPVKIDSEKVRSCCYVRTDRKAAMLALGDFGATRDVKVDVSALGYGDCRVVDVESGQRIESKNGVFNVAIPHHDFRLYSIDAMSQTQAR